MKVRYRPAWSIVFLVLAFLTLGITLAAFLLGGKLSVPPFVPGVICLILGISYRRRPYFEMTDGQLRAPAALGPLVKTYDFQDISQLSVRDKRVWVKGVKTGLSRTMAHVDDWAAFQGQIEAAETFE